MSKRSTNLNRGHRSARLSAENVAGLAHALGLTIDDLYPMFDLKLADGRIVQQRGVDGVDAARRHWQATGEQPVGVRKHQD